MDRIGDVNEVQGLFLRKLLKLRGAAPLTEREYQRAHEEHCKRNGRRPFEGRGGAVALEVNHGRWVATCPACNSGMSSGVGWAGVRCFGCGALWAATWPAAAERIRLERFLLERPEVNRNWRPGESVGLVVSENLARGIGRERIRGGGA